MNPRRSLLSVVPATLLAPWTVFAQTKKQPVLIGWLSSGNPAQRSFAAFKEGLAALGWKEGAQVVIEGRWAGGRRGWYSLRQSSRSSSAG